MLTLLLASGLLGWSAFAPTAGAAAGVASAVPSYQLQTDNAARQWGDFSSQPHIRARLWVDGERDYFRSGDRLRVRFSTSEDAYVALIHVDPDGRLEFLFPSNPWESDFVRGGRAHSLPRAHQAGLSVRGRPGIGYLYLIASPVPLDYRHFSRGRGSPWDWSYAGRSVVGDPFWAMEQITRLLIPDYAPYASDYYSYYVDGRHRYPSYACADRYTGVRGGWGWSSGFGSCSRLDLFLRQHPHYYDTRLYRGDRRVFIARTYGPPPAQHRFKEPGVARSPAVQAPGQPRNRAPAQSGAAQDRAGSPSDRAGAARPVTRPPADRQPASAAEPRQSAPEQRQRPTLERREPQRESGSQDRAPAGRAEPREPQRERSGSGSARGSERRGTSPAPAARGTERRGGSPAPQAAPAREPAPSGSARSRRPPGGDDS